MTTMSGLMGAGEMPSADRAPKVEELYIIAYIAKNKAFQYVLSRYSHNFSSY